MKKEDRLRAIQAEAKRLKKKHPNKKHTELVKMASKNLFPKSGKGKKSGFNLKDWWNSL